MLGCAERQAQFIILDSLSGILAQSNQLTRFYVSSQYSVLGFKVERYFNVIPNTVPAVALKPLAMLKVHRNVSGYHEFCQLSRYVNSQPSHIHSPVGGTNTAVFVNLNNCLIWRGF